MSPSGCGERPAADLLAGDVGVLPLAPLGRLPPGSAVEAGLAGVIQQVIERLQREAPPEQARRLLTAAFVLTGLRVSREVARLLFQGAQAMRDSDTCLAILEEGEEKGRQEGRQQGREDGRQEGRIEEVRKLLLRVGQKALGAPGEAVTTALAAVTDLERLEFWLERVGEVKNWQELLALR